MRMHPLTLVLPALLLAACTDRRAQEDDTTPTPSDQVATPAPPGEPGADVTATPAPTYPEGTPVTPATTGTPSQSDALGLLIAANQHEVAAADQAIGKKVTGDVLAFAQMMKTDHGKNLDETRKLGAATEGADVAAMKAKGAADLATLGAKSGAEYQKAYVDAMVQGHTEVLSMLDSKLIPAATDAAVKAHFTATRAAVAKHLEEARKLQAGP